MTTLRELREAQKRIGEAIVSLGCNDTASAFTELRAAEGVIGSCVRGHDTHDGPDSGDAEAKGHRIAELESVLRDLRDAKTKSDLDGAIARADAMLTADEGEVVASVIEGLQDQLDAEAEPAASEGEDDDTPCVECGGPIAVKGTVNCLCCALGEGKVKHVEAIAGEVLLTSEPAISRRDEFVKIAFDRIMEKHIKGVTVEPVAAAKLNEMVAYTALQFANALERQVRADESTQWAVAK